MSEHNISFELTLGEMASGAKDTRVWARFGPRKSVGRAAQFIVIRALRARRKGSTVQR